MVRPTTLYRSTGALNIRDKNSSNPEHKLDFSQFKYKASYSGKESQAASASKEVLAVREKLDQLKDLLEMVYNITLKLNIWKSSLLLVKLNVNVKMFSKFLSMFALFYGIIK